MNKESLSSFGLFMGFFVLFGYSCSVTLPPYRDAGEMAILLQTLGVAHPPGYPLYALLGKLFSVFLVTNLVYEVNLFSAFCGALAVMVLFQVLRNWMEYVPSLFGSMVFGFSNPFWELSVVTEMYSLGVLWLTLLLYACFVKKNAYLTGFLMALGLGVRMDMMLIYPFFVFWFAFHRKFKNWGMFAIFFLLGLSVFLFMPIRSLQNPVLDWANPDSLKIMFNSVSRKSYGGTLDLLSLNYKKGENFFVGLNHYFGHFYRSLGFWIWPFLFLGLWRLYHEKRTLFLFFVATFVTTVPIYLFLANMPPNTHALAILEAAYPVPDLILVVFIAFGLSFAMRKKFVQKALCFLVPVFLFVKGVDGFEWASKRKNMFTRDYITNVFRSSPRGAVVVFHEDVQLFSLWKAQVLDGKRKDCTLVATGLSASPWYWDMLERWGTPKAPPVSLKSDSGFLEMKKKIGPRPLVVGQETSVNATKGSLLDPHGFLIEVLESGKESSRPSEHILDELSLYRGNYQYGRAGDFFSSDLVADYARAYTRWGLKVLQKGEPNRAESFLQRAEVLDPTFPRPSTHRGYLAFRKGDYDTAIGHYENAIQKHKEVMNLSVEYKSLPDLIRGIKMEASETYVYAGAAAEKKQDLDLARRYYGKAIHLSPNAQAHYNMAVTYWQKDWSLVVQNLRSALQINPTMEVAKKYLAQALYLQRGSRP